MPSHGQLSEVDLFLSGTGCWCCTVTVEVLAASPVVVAGVVVEGDAGVGSGGS